MRPARGEKWENKTEPNNILQLMKNYKSGNNFHVKSFYLFFDGCLRLTQVVCVGVGYVGALNLDAEPFCHLFLTLFSLTAFLFLRYSPAIAGNIKQGL